MNPFHAKNNPLPTSTKKEYVRPPTVILNFFSGNYDYDDGIKQCQGNIEAIGNGDYAAGVNRLVAKARLNAQDQNMLFLVSDCGSVVIREDYRT